MSWNSEEKPKKFKRAKPSMKDAVKKLEESEVDATIAIHHVIESIEWNLRNFMQEDESVVKIIKSTDTVGEAFEELVKAGKTDYAKASMVLATMDDLHETLHELMQGIGIKDISDRTNRMLARAWLESEEFADKYSRLDGDNIEKLKRSLGA